MRSPAPEHFLNALTLKQLRELILAFDKDTENKGGTSQKGAVAAAIKNNVTIDWIAVQSPPDPEKEAHSPYKVDALVRTWWQLGKCDVPITYTPATPHAEQVKDPGSPLTSGSSLTSLSESEGLPVINAEKNAGKVALESNKLTEVNARTYAEVGIQNVLDLPDNNADSKNTESNSSESDPKEDSDLYKYTIDKVLVRIGDATKSGQFKGNAALFEGDKLIAESYDGQPAVDIMSIIDFLNDEEVADKFHGPFVVVFRTPMHSLEIPFAGRHSDDVDFQLIDDANPRVAPVFWSEQKKCWRLYLELAKFPEPTKRSKQKNSSGKSLSGEVSGNHRVRVQARNDSDIEMGEPDASASDKMEEDGSKSEYETDDSEEESDTSKSGASVQEANNLKSPTRHWLHREFKDHVVVIDIKENKKKGRTSHTAKKLKEWIDFIYPLMIDKPVTDIKRNAMSAEAMMVTRTDIASLVGRGLTWVDQCRKAGLILSDLDLDSKPCAKLKGMLEGRRQDQFGMSSFLKYLEDRQARLAKLQNRRRERSTISTKA